MAFSKNRRLADLVTATGEVSSYADASVTHADLHTDMNLTAKTVLVANASTGDSDTTAANTAFVQQEIAALVDSAPGTLNTLNELAAALGDDASFSTTVTNSIATKLPLAGGTLTGDLVLKSDGGNDVINVVHSGNTVQLVSIGQSSDNSGNGVIQLKRNNGVLHSQIHSHGNTYFNGGNVGIGFASGTPDRLLHVKGTGNIYGKFETTNATGAGIEVKDTSEDWLIQADGGSVDGLAFYDLGRTEYRMVIDDSGNVGIGTTGPEERVHIEKTGSGKQTALRLANENTTGGAGPELLFTSGTSNYGASIYGYGTALNAADLFFTAGGNTPRLRIHSDGNIDASTNSNTTALRVPNGTTGQRPTGATGMMRYNTTKSKLEAYIGTSWESLATGFEASGGTETTATISGVNYKIHAFTSSGTFTVTTGSASIDILVVAGGGGGGGSTAGGGGAGGLIYQSGVGVLAGNYTITVGAGGAGSRRSDQGAANNTNGSNSTAFSYTAIGGGYGYSGYTTGSRLANSGGSGGGGGAYSGNDIATSSGAAGTSGQGYAGGAGNDPSNWGGGGGGGATAVGVDQTGTRAGGAGSNRSSIYGTTYGESGVFAGGGGGGAYSSGVTQGGTGGGGNGGDGQNHAAAAATANTGGGGGGGGYYQYGPGGGAGGSGIVLIRYAV